MFNKVSVIPTILVVLFIGLLGILLLILTFFREMPKELAFFLTSPLTINLVAYFGLVVTYTDIPFDVHTVIVAICFWFFLLLVFWFIRKVFPEAKIAENLPALKEELPRFEH